ncbi:MAG: hypothetical protein ACHRHE_02975 [Tepidisphaerales bacterium]
MTTAMAPTAQETDPRPWLWAGLIPGLLGLAVGIVVMATVPPSLGTLYGGLAAATVMLPGLVLAQGRWLDRLGAIVCFTVPLAATWVHLVYRDTMQGGEWMAASVVLLAYGWGIGGVACLLRMLAMQATKRRSETLRVLRAGSATKGRESSGDAAGVLAAAGAVVAGVLWLSWPIWTAPRLSGPAGEKTVARLVAVHPAFALNGPLLRAFPVPWAQYRLAYELTDIGTSIPYEMPTRVWPCVLLHAVVGLCAIGCRRAKRNASLSGSVGPGMLSPGGLH